MKMSDTDRNCSAPICPASMPEDALPNRPAAPPRVWLFRGRSARFRSPQLAEEVAQSVSLPGAQMRDYFAANTGFSPALALIESTRGPRFFDAVAPRRSRPGRVAANNC